MLQWEVLFVPPARIKPTAHDGQGHMCEIKSSGCNICPYSVFSAGFALDLRMTTRKHLLKVRVCSPGSQSQFPVPGECGYLKMGPAESQAEPLGHPVCFGAKPAGGPCLELEFWSGHCLLWLGDACMCQLGLAWGNVCPSH